MFNLSRDNSLIDKATLSELLDITISSKIKGRGLVRQSDYLWHPSSTAIIRPGLKYNLLKGEQGTFSWGVCLDFVPLSSGSNLTCYNTDKKFAFHLFEWPDEYSNSFFGGSLQNATAIHWGRSEAEKSIRKLFERNESKIINWFNQATTPERIIELLLNQIQVGRQYNLHYPSPKYALAFLYAKTHQYEKATQLFDSLDLNDFNNKEEVRAKARKKLIELSVTKNDL